VLLNYAAEKDLHDKRLWTALSKDVGRQPTLLIRG